MVTAAHYSSGKTPLVQAIFRAAYNKLIELTCRVEFNIEVLKVLCYKALS